MKIGSFIPLKKWGWCLGFVTTISPTEGADPSLSDELALPLEIPRPTPNWNEATADDVPEDVPVLGAPPLVGFTALSCPLQYGSRGLLKQASCQLKRWCWPQRLTAHVSPKVSTRMFTIWFCGFRRLVGIRR